MDSTTFVNLTGRSLNSSHTARYATVVANATAQLEQMLGYPLNPSDWENQYLEIGKTKSDWSWPDVATDDLDDPDVVVGKNRLFAWHADEPYLTLDPASDIHSVKLVNDGITYHTFTGNEFRKVIRNGKVPMITALNWQPSWFSYHYFQTFRRYYQSFQVAVDAEWMFAKDSDNDSTLPPELQRVLASLVDEELFGIRKRDIKSETVLSHSYTLADGKEATSKYADVLQRYAGPNGSFKKPRIA